LNQAEQFARASYISIETYRKNGEPVRTPVWVVEDGGMLYVMTDPASGKVKRIRHDQHVRVAKADMRGNVGGEWADGEANLVRENELARIQGLFRKKYGLQMRLFGFLDRFGGSRDRSAVVRIQLRNE